MPRIHWFAFAAVTLTLASFVVLSQKSESDAWDGRVFQIVGKSNWQIETVDGVELVAPASIFFDETDIHIAPGCRHYGYLYAREGSDFLFNPNPDLALIAFACNEALESQTRGILGVLSDAANITTPAENRLIIIDKNGRRIIANRMSVRKNDNESASQ